MAHFLNLVQQFRTDERGVFGMIFAIIAVVLIALSGSVVDFVHVQQVRNQAQVALDAAALGLQEQIFVKPLNLTSIKVSAQKLVDQQIGDSAVTAVLDTPVVDIPNGSLTLSAQLTVPTFFVTLVGVDTLGASVVSQATRRKMALEVAMVLDNSGSMQGSRMSNLKTAATCATNILFYGAVSDDSCVPVSTTKTVEDVSIGIVPFTVMVNIGTQFKDATWLDWAGKSSVARINFDNDDNASTPFTGPVNRKDLFTQTGTNWLGCVEARKSPYDTTDEEPSTIPGKEDTLFVPLFTPDGFGSQVIYRNGYYSNDSGSRGNYISDTSSNTCTVRTCTVVTKNGSSSYTLTIGSKVTTPKASCVPTTDPVRLTGLKSGSTTTEVYSLLSKVELQSRLCKYDGASSVSNNNTNYGCPSVPVLPMTETPQLVLDKIDDMVANGSTNIQQGAIWGVHALTHGEPLTQGRVRNDTDVRKALIIMTDGENDPPFYSSDFNGGDYFSWGFPYDGRLADTQNEVSTETKIRAIQDAKTIAACATAKALGMEVFTIGLSSPAGVKSMLTTCSSGANYAFFPNSPDQLIPTFRNIANQLAPLSITK